MFVPPVFGESDPAVLDSMLDRAGVLAGLTAEPAAGAREMAELIRAQSPA